MRSLFHLFIILCVLAGFGAAKLRYEDQLQQRLVSLQLLQPPLKEGANLQLGQTGAAVALGGLRSLVAAIWNLRAFLHFEKLDWIKLEESYGIITTLQPQNISYWDTGAWHLHTNASVYYKEKKDIPPLRRAAMQDKYIKKGSSFLEEGVRQNPDSWRLHYALARLWSDPHKSPDYARALKHYNDALATKSLPDFKRGQLNRFAFYSLARVPEKAKDAYALGRQLFDASPRNHTPNLVSILFALQNKLHLSEKESIPEKQLFPNAKAEKFFLGNYWRHRHQNYPMDGVKIKLSELERAR